MQTIVNNFDRLSIHAPTRGATTFQFLSLMFHVFQSTLLQEERRLVL